MATAVRESMLSPLDLIFIRSSWKKSRNRIVFFLIYDMRIDYQSSRILFQLIMIITKLPSFLRYILLIL